jgi:hypothetical protein
LSPSSEHKEEAVYSYETFVVIYNGTWFHNPKDQNSSFSPSGKQNILLMLSLYLHPNSNIEKWTVVRSEIRRFVTHDIDPIRIRYSTY